MKTYLQEKTWVRKVKKGEDNCFDNESATGQAGEIRHNLVQVESLEWSW